MLRRRMRFDKYASGPSLPGAPQTMMLVGGHLVAHASGQPLPDSQRVLGPDTIGRCSSTILRAAARSCHRRGSSPHLGYLGLPSSRPAVSDDHRTAVSFGEWLPLRFSTAPSHTHVVIASGGLASKPCTAHLAPLCTRIRGTGRARVLCLCTRRSTAPLLRSAPTRDVPSPRPGQEPRPLNQRILQELAQPCLPFDRSATPPAAVRAGGRPRHRKRHRLAGRWHRE